MYAADSLGKIGSSTSIKPLVDVFDGQDLSLKVYAISALANFESIEAINLLIKGLRDPYWKVRHAAADGLTIHKPDVSIPILRYKAERDPEVIVREEAIIALAKFGHIDSRSYLYSLISDSNKSLSLRSNAVRALIKYDSSGSLSFIKGLINEHIDSSDKSIMASICQELLASQSTLAEEFYKQFLTSKQVWVRIFGVRGIGQTKPVGYEAILDKIQQTDSDENVRRISQHFLSQ